MKTAIGCLALIALLVAIPNRATGQPGSQGNLSWSDRYVENGHEIIIEPKYNGIMINNRPPTLERFCFELGLSYVAIEQRPFSGSSNTSYGYNYGSWESHDCSYDSWHWDDCSHYPYKLTAQAGSPGGTKRLLFLKNGDPATWTSPGSSGNQSTEISEWESAGYTVDARSAASVDLTASLLSDFDIVRIETYGWSTQYYTPAEGQALYNWVQSGGRLLASVAVQSEIEVIQPFGVERIDGAAGGSTGLSWTFHGAPWYVGPVMGPNGSVSSIAAEAMDRPHLASGHSLTIDATAGGYPVVAHGEFGTGKAVIVFIAGWSHTQTFSGNAYRAVISQGGNLAFLRNVISYLDECQSSHLSVELTIIDNPHHDLGKFDAGPNAPSQLQVSLRLKNNETVALRNVQLSCKVNGSTDGVTLQAGSAGLLSELVPGATDLEEFALIDLDERVSQGLIIECDIVTVDGQSVTAHDETTLDVAYCARGTSRLFKFQDDVYPFKNGRLDWSGVWKTIKTEPLVSPVLLFARQVNGSCYGIAATAAEYFDEPWTIPGSAGKTSELELADPGVEENIVRYHFSQLFQGEFWRKFTSVDQGLEADHLVTLIKNNTPAMLAIEGGQHAVMCYKVIVYRDKSYVTAYLYDNNVHTSTSMDQLVGIYDVPNKKFYQGNKSDKSIVFAPYYVMTYAELASEITSHVKGSLTELNDNLEKWFGLGCPARMRISLSDGRQLGYLPNGNFVNEIPDAVVVEYQGEGLELYSGYSMPDDLEVETVAINCLDSGLVTFTVLDPSQDQDHEVQTISIFANQVGTQIEILPGFGIVTVDDDGDGNPDSWHDLKQWVSGAFGHIEGLVLECEEPLPSVQVSAFDSTSMIARTTLTDSRGWYRLDFLPNGAYTITAKGNSGTELQHDSAEIEVTGLVHRLDLSVPKLARVDVKPGSCPNPLNVKYKHEIMVSSAGKDFGESIGGGVLPVAILGSDDLDIDEISAETIRLEGIPAIRWNSEDVATPVNSDGDTCKCSSDGPDGYMDLTLKFLKKRIVDSLGDVRDGEVLPLTVTGSLKDGCELVGEDCVIIRAAREQENDVSIFPAGLGSSDSLSNYPNPFNAGTTIRYDLAEESNVRLEIFDVLGRRVATLIDARQPAGRHEVAWDGRDEANRSVASGMYFYRLTAGSHVQSRQMVLLK